METLTIFKSKDKPIERAGEAYAREKLEEAFRQSVDVAAVARVLNGVERRLAGLPLCEVMALPLKDALRLFALAKVAIRGLDPEVMASAVDEVAYVICEGMEGEFERLDNQSPAMRVRYQRWAQTAVNAFLAKLEGR